MQKKYKMNTLYHHLDNESNIGPYKITLLFYRYVMLHSIVMELSIPNILDRVKDNISLLLTHPSKQVRILSELIIDIDNVLNVL